MNLPEVKGSGSESYARSERRIDRASKRNNRFFAARLGRSQRDCERVTTEIQSSRVTPPPS